VIVLEFKRNKVSDRTDFVQKLFRM